MFCLTILVAISEFCETFKLFQFIISFLISDFVTSFKKKTVLGNRSRSWMIYIFHSSFQDRIIYVLTVFIIYQRVYMY